MYRNFALPAVLFCFALILPAVPALAAGPGFSDTTGQPRMQTTVPTGRIVIHFAPEAGLRGGFQGIELGRNAKAASSGHAARVNNLVTSLAAGARLEGRFPDAPRPGDKAFGGRAVPDLGLYAHFDARTLDRGALVKIAAALSADPAIDLAYLEPEAVPAALGFDAATGGFTPPLLPSAKFDTLQGYMEDAPQGIGALSMRLQPGALGSGVGVIDIEGGWLWSHEDLPTPMWEIGGQIDDLSWRNHGTAVVGVIRGEDNGIGVTGIAPLCDVGNSSIGTQYTAQAILNAAAVLSAGDVIVIEIHAAGPEATGVGQEGYVPMEFWQDVFDAIQVVNAQGILVCEAAGNGAVDLDNPLYQGLFDRNQRDSGAIMIGATNGELLAPAWFTNNGTRVDLNGWGFNVATLAYGDLQGDPEFPEQQWYTAQFNGTSSATPVVTGAVVGLQGMVRAMHGMDLDARLARDILLATGTMSTGPQLIGARPDLVAAHALADTGIGAVTGTVTDLVGGLPIEGVLVQVTGGGAWTMTAADGTWSLPLLTGAVDFDFSDFNYQTLQAGAVISTGATSVLDVQLTPLPQVEISGTVFGGLMPVQDALVTPLINPVAPTSSGLGGYYALQGLPSGSDYSLLFDGVPGFGAQIVDLPLLSGDAHISPRLDAIVEDFETDDGGFIRADTLWSWGAPPAGVTGDAFSGSNCWGIGMDGSGYGDASTDTLTSPVYDLSPLDGANYFMSFHLWSATETGFDGVHLLVSDGGPFTVLTPVGGYTDLFLGGLGQNPGWSGETGRWQGTVFDVTSFQGGDLQFQLVFGSDGGVTGDGFFIDGITFGLGFGDHPSYGNPPSPVPEGRVIAHLRAWPNPFNPKVTIAWSVPEVGRLQVAVFDLRGRRVRMLHDGPVTSREGLVSWDGRDSRGRTAASGVYLVQLQGVGGAVASQRVVLTK